MKVIKTKVLALCSVGLIFGLSGCSGGPTPEEKAQNEAFKRQFIANMMQSRAGAKQNISNQFSNTQIKKDENFISDEELVKKMKQFPPLTKGVKFTKLKDGFKINNKNIFVDPEGEIVSYGYNGGNGSVTYMLKTSSNTYKIKYTCALNNNMPIDIATVKKSGNTLKTTTVTGKKFSSKGIILTSKGFVTMRGNNAFIYNIGEDIKTFNAPEGWHIAKFQNGDIASTKYILLERTVNKASNSLFDLIDSTEELASSLGLTDKQDYMLINIENPEKRNLFNITLGSKNIGLYSECEQANKYVQKCNNVEFKESLYTTYGLPNSGHYYWAILWFATRDGGAIAATRENTQRGVYITDLETGIKKEGAYRVTGFPELFAEQDANGKIKVIAGGGVFPDEVIEDAISLLNTDNK